MDVAVVVEPIVSDEKLRECLAEQHEQSCLDYKKRLDFQTTLETLKFALDVAALSSEPHGGYVVVGADGQGNPVGDLEGIDLSQFDESRLRSRVAKYISGPFEIRVGLHQVDEHPLVLIFVGPSPTGWSIMALDGEYKDEKTGKSNFAFRRGDVYVRRGTSNERWNHDDKTRLIEQLISRERERWRREFRDEAVGSASIGASVDTLRNSRDGAAITWEIDGPAYDELVMQLLRANDDIPLRRILFQLRRDAAKHYTSNSDEINDLLDRITQFAAIALQFQRPEWFRDAVTCFVRVYENGFDERGHERGTHESVMLWLEIISRVHAIGALAVRLENWAAIGFLTSRRPNAEQFQYYGSWLRHGLTMAARANLVEGQNNLIARGANVVRRLACLRPEEAEESEAIATSLCQFDVYGCLNVMGSRRSLDSSNYYPSFARYHSYRSVPAFVRLVEDETARREIFGEDKVWLAACMKELIESAEKEGFRYMAWMGVNSKEVAAFLADNPPASSTTSVG